MSTLKPTTARHKKKTSTNNRRQINMSERQKSTLFRSFLGSVCICLAVILNTPDVEAQQLERSLQSHNHNSMFKDLSGPTSGKIQTLDVICGKNFMTVRAEFSAPFYGIVFSKGTYGQENCIYVKPNSGLTHAAFNVYYDQCGTKPDLQGKFYENTIVIQYGSDIIEAYDEAKRLRCEWFEAYEKPATFKPAIPVADLEVVEMNFQGDDIDCWMEIQDGTGPWSREVAKIVPVGQPMTIVVAINDYNGQFDMRVKSCVAHDGIQQPIVLTDEYGCVLRPKMLTPFTKLKNPESHKKATILSYSRFLAFKFPDSMTVQIQCTVEVCRHGCADACQRVPSIAASNLQPELSLSAKWPAAPNQAAIQEAPRLAKPQPDSDNQYLAASRVQFSKQPERNYLAGPQSNSLPSEYPNDDMSGSDSSHQPSAVAFGQSLNNQRRSQDGPVDGRVPQYLNPSIGSQRIPQRQVVSLPSSPRTTPSTAAPTTTSSTSAPAITDAPQSSQDNSNRVASDESPESSANDDGMIRLNSAGEQSPVVKNSEMDSNEASIDQQDTKAEASQVKQTIVVPEEPNKPPVADQSNLSDSGESSDSKPSVQSPDEIQDSNLKRQDVGDSNSPLPDSSIGSVDSSLKTVELEIPANEDPVRTLIASSSGVNSTQRGLFNSNRLSNVDLNANNNPGAFNYGNEQVIQPREPQQVVDKRNKNEDTDIDNIMASSKARFGARSQPSVQVNQAEPDRLYNHQASAGSDQESAVAKGDGRLESILIDRSDDSSSLTEIASSSVNDQSNSESKPMEGSDESSSVVEYSGSNSKVQPVVGTEELASGTLQIEDRIGAAAPNPESLEQALSRLQQQIPQKAALINSQDSQSESLDKKQDTQASQEKPVEVAAQNQKQSESLNDRSDSGPKKAAEVAGQQNQRQANQVSQRDQVNQPHPNVVGQAKVMPDPNGNSNSRNPMFAQASNLEGVQSVPLVSQPSAPVNQQVPLMMPLQEQPSRPVAQITNVPINIGFPPSQIPAIQQLSQQLAYFQQQQNQQQQQQQPPKSTTSKPTRGRFNLLSPQAALQAVASRFLAKSTTPQPAQTNSQIPLNQQLPQFLTNFKLQPQQQQQQVQQQQANFLPANQQQQQFLPNRIMNQKAPIGASLFNRLSGSQQPQPQQQPQALLRSRRSALSQSDQPGKGEIGMTKTFMVVTGMDLAFMANSTESEQPQILEGRRLVDDDVIYGVCMPIISLTFVLTCAFWLVVFICSFCIYMLIKSKKQENRQESMNYK